jgi:chitinase
VEGGHSLQLDNGDNNFMNPTTAKVVNMIAGIKEIINHRKGQGKDCWLTMAPETYYVQTAYGANYSPLVGAYLPLIHALRNELTFIHPQYYNTGTVMGMDNKIYAQATPDFIVAMSEMLLKGFPVAGTGQTFAPLREDQVAFGLPAAPSAAPSGGYLSPAGVKQALNYLTKGQSFGGGYVLQKPGGYPGLRGIMTWSVNWDKTNGDEFANNYYDYFFGGSNPGNTPPTVSMTANLTGNTINIQASASDADGSVTKVEFFNGGTKLGEATAAPYAYNWTNVANGSYVLTAKATDNGGAVSTSSPITIVVGSTGCSGINTWSASQVYTATNQAVYNNKVYEAKWWTQGEQPDVSTGDGKPWKYIKDCDGGSGGGNNGGSCSGVATYEVYPRIYNKGDKVVYNGNLYESQSDALYNVTPGTADWWWKPLGACPAATSANAATNMATAAGGAAVVPNPVSGSRMQVLKYANAGDRLIVEVQSMKGYTVLRREFVAGATGVNTFPLETTKLQQGIWIIYIRNVKTGQVSTTRLVKL